jgi:hypothetical protein
MGEVTKMHHFTTHNIITTTTPPSPSADIYFKLHHSTKTRKELSKISVLRN